MYILVFANWKKGLIWKILYLKENNIKIIIIIIIINY